MNAEAVDGHCNVATFFAMNYLRKLKDYVLGEVWLLTLPFSLLL